MGVNGFVKCEIQALAAGQSIRNILYYGNEDIEEVPNIDAAFLTAFAGEWLEAYQDMWLNGLPSTYAMTGLNMTVVDARGVQLDQYAVFIAGAGTGLQSSDLDTVAITAIVKFVTLGSQALGARSMRRSYLAYGPISSTFINNDGSLTGAGLVQLADVLPVVTGAVDVGFVPLLPVRIGRTESPEQLAVGGVVTASIQPFVSFRKSRKVRPSGT